MICSSDIGRRYDQKTVWSREIMTKTTNIFSGPYIFVLTDQELIEVYGFASLLLITEFQCCKVNICNLLKPHLKLGEDAYNSKSKAHVTAFL